MISQLEVEPANDAGAMTMFSAAAICPAGP
jgi:hypothetical protein